MAKTTRADFEKLLAYSDKMIQAVGVARMLGLWTRYVGQKTMKKEAIFAAGVEAGMRLIIHAREGAAKKEKQDKSTC